MKSLDEQIADIENLDTLRRYARGLQQEAIEALTVKVYVPRPRPRMGKLNEAAAERPGWDLPGDDIEKAEMLWALAKLAPKEEGSETRRAQSRKALIDDLQATTYADCVHRDDALDNVPILRCALVLRALAETPGYALSNAAMICFYRIVEELSLVSGPTWTNGAARAGETAIATAFITGECARALLAVEKALRQTAKAAEVLGQEAAREAKFLSELGVWRIQEEKFRAAALEISLAELPHLVTLLPTNRPDGKAGWALELLGMLINTLSGIPKIADLKLPKPRKPVAAKPGSGLLDIAPNYFKSAAQDIAWNAVNELLESVRSDPSAPLSDSEARGKEIANRLRRGAQVVRDLLAPMGSFAESIIDREIAAGTHLKASVDGAELVFAANLLGLTLDWNRPKVRAAYELLRPLLSVHGRLLSIRPFDVGGKGYRLNVATIEVTRRLADLVAELDVEPDVEFVTRLIRPFDYTRVAAAKKSESGWTTDPTPRQPKSLWWITALALDALGSVIRMLDEAINRQVLKHFQVRRPESLKLDLNGLFYPDYGLAGLPGGRSTALKLQELRGHAGHGPAKPDRLLSLVLYGPPGTGKTTLVEAVAKTAGVPLVEITPSDILVGGAEGVERRTRHVFQALSKLTHVVILFDEFDSILLDRAKRNPDEIPTSVIEFLTPGMLPKLKALNDAGRELRISYVLATNFVDRLDSAVTRRGRFDEQLGVYPPDVASRLGRLLIQLKVFGEKVVQARTKLEGRRTILQEEKRKGATGAGLAQIELQLQEVERQLQRLKTLEERIDQPAIMKPLVLRAIKATGGAAMDQIAKPGWFTAPEVDGYQGKLFDYLLDGTKADKILGDAAGTLQTKSHREQEFKKVFEEEKRRVLAAEVARRRAQAEAIGEAPETPTEPELEAKYHEYWKTWRIVDNWEVEAKSIGESASANWDKLYEAVSKATSP
jgi:hypothetical protein